MSAAVSTLVPRAPPRSTSSGFVRAVSRSALAAATESSWTNVRAVGPTSSSCSPSSPACSAANRARVFLYTLCSAPLSRSAPRSVARAPTFMPRYSVTKTALAPLSFDAISSTIATFSARGFSISMHTSSLMSRGDSLWSEHHDRRDLRGACTSVGGKVPLPTRRWTDGLRRATVWIDPATIAPPTGRHSGACPDGRRRMPLGAPEPSLILPRPSSYVARGRVRCAVRREAQQRPERAATTTRSHAPPVRQLGAAGNQAVSRLLAPSDGGPVVQRDVASDVEERMSYGAFDWAVTDQEAIDSLNDLATLPTAALATTMARLSRHRQVAPARQHAGVGSRARPASPRCWWRWDRRPCSRTCRAC